MPCQCRTSGIFPSAPAAQTRSGLPLSDKIKLKICLFWEALHSQRGQPAHGRPRHSVFCISSHSLLWTDPLEVEQLASLPFKLVDETKKTTWGDFKVDECVFPQLKWKLIGLLPWQPKTTHWPHLVVLLVH